ADGEVEALLESQRIRIAAKLFLEVERRIARPPRMVLVCDRRAEERHDAITGELGDGPLEATDPFGKQRGEWNTSGSSCSSSSIAPFTSAKSMVTCLRSPSRAAVDWRILSAQVLRGVRARVACGRSISGRAYPRAAARAEPGRRLELSAAGRARVRTQP